MRIPTGSFTKESSDIRPDSRQLGLSNQLTDVPDIGMGYFARHRIFGNYTRQLALTGSLLALSSANYGFDNQGFGSTQAMDPFIREFGERQASGKFAIPPYFLSLLNSLVFIGFAIGTYTSRGD